MVEQLLGKNTQQFFARLYMRGMMMMHDVQY